MKNNKMFIKAGYDPSNNTPKMLGYTVIILISLLVIGLQTCSAQWEEMTVEKYRQEVKQAEIKSLIMLSTEVGRIGLFTNKASMQILLITKFLPGQWPTIFIIPGILLQAYNLIINEYIKTKI